jgi:hypothetical protein
VTDESISYLPSDTVQRGHLLILLLLGFGVFFLIDYELAAMLSNAVSVTWTFLRTLQESVLSNSSNRTW